MLDTRLAAALFAAVPSRAHLLLVGDVDQLPSVGAGNVLKDLIAVAAARASSLRFRHAAHRHLPPGGPESHRHDRARHQRRRRRSPAGRAESRAVPAVERPRFRRRPLRRGLRAEGPRALHRVHPAAPPWLHPVNDVQVLAPMHKGVAGVANLNRQLQAALNPGGRRDRPGPAHRGPCRRIPARRQAHPAAQQLRQGPLQRRHRRGRHGRRRGAARSTADFDGETHVFDARRFRRPRRSPTASASTRARAASIPRHHPAAQGPLHDAAAQPALHRASPAARRRSSSWASPRPTPWRCATANPSSGCTHLREKLAAAAESR